MRYTADLGYDSSRIYDCGGKMNIARIYRYFREKKTT